MCGCLWSLVNAILGRGTSTGLVTSLLMCSLLLYWKAYGSGMGRFPFGEGMSLERRDCVLLVKKAEVEVFISGPDVLRPCTKESCGTAVPRNP